MTDYRISKAPAGSTGFAGFLQFKGRMEIETFHDAVFAARSCAKATRGTIAIHEIADGDTSRIAFVSPSCALRPNSAIGERRIASFTEEADALSPSEAKIAAEMMEADEEMTFGEAKRRVREGSLRLGAAVDRLGTLKTILLELDAIAQRVETMRGIIREEIDG